MTQKINLETDLMYNDKRWRKKFNLKKELLKCSILVTLLIGIAYSLPYHEEPALLKDPSSCKGCHNRHDAMSRYFESKGSPDPQRMATAVLETNRPRLMASIAVRESQGNPKAVGDGGKSKGAFQCQTKHWAKLMHEGKVSKDPVVQALDSERILEEFIAANNGDLKKALNGYNGDLTKKVYAKNILKEAKNIP